MKPFRAAYGFFATELNAELSVKMPLIKSTKRQRVTLTWAVFVFLRLPIRFFNGLM